VTGEIGVGRGQRIDPLIVHPQAVHFGEKFVPDGALDGPILLQVLVVFQDLLDVDPPLRQQCAQPLEVLQRFAQAIRMIDPHPVDLALHDHRRDARMCGFENGRQLRADAAQGPDIEKAAVVAEFSCELPAVKQVELPLQRRVQ